MKIKRTAGKIQSIKISYDEWERIGETTGWAKQAQEAVTPDDSYIKYLPHVILYAVSETHPPKSQH